MCLCMCVCVCITLFYKRILTITDKSDVIIIQYEKKVEICRKIINSFSSLMLQGYIVYADCFNLKCLYDIQSNNK